MKKKIFFATVALTAAVSTTIGMHRVDCDKVNPLKMVNIEALTTKEVTVTECPGGKDACAAILQNGTLHVFTMDK